MFGLLYSIGLHLYALASLPKMWFTKRAIRPRLGQNFPHVEKGAIWLHAVSLGEMKAVTLLAQMLKGPLLITSSTDTGLAEARRAFPDAATAYLPFDLSYIIRPIVRRIQPKLLILCEGDLWLNLLKAAKEVRAKTALVNGKISERSLERHLKFPWLGRHLFAQLDLVIVQNRLYQERFEQLGVESVVSGNLKFDGMSSGGDDFPIAGEGPLVVLGSTHDPEEQQLMEQLLPVMREREDLRVLVVPRHPQRFDRVASILRELEIPFSRYSSGELKEQVILVDAVGVLRDIYRRADVALVAGSWTARVGGHNILEPLMEGTACLFGPHMATQRELEDLVLTAGAGRQVEVDEVAREVLELIVDDEKRERLVESGRTLIENLQGATDRTFNLLSQIAPIG